MSAQPSGQCSSHDWICKRRWTDVESGHCAVWFVHAADRGMEGGPCMTTLWWQHCYYTQQVMSVIITTIVMISAYVLVSWSLLTLSVSRESVHMYVRCSDLCVYRYMCIGAFVWRHAACYNSRGALSSAWRHHTCHMNSRADQCNLMTLQCCVYVFTLWKVIQRLTQLSHRCVAFPFRHVLYTYSRSFRSCRPWSR